MLTIVFLDVADPVASGFVSSLAHPGGNATGLANINIELSAKRLDLLAAIPRLSRVVVLGCCFGTPVDAILHRFMDETITAAKAMRVSAKPIPTPRVTRVSVPSQRSTVSQIVPRTVAALYRPRVR